MQSMGSQRVAHNSLTQQIEQHQQMHEWGSGYVAKLCMCSSGLL